MTLYNHAKKTEPWSDEVKKNAILIDYIQIPEWGFLRRLDEATQKKWELECQESSTDIGGVKNLLRYFKYFTFPLHVVFGNRKYESVIAWQQFFGIVLSFYFRLFRFKRESCPHLYIMELIYKPKTGVFGRVYDRFVRYSISSEYVTKIFVFSNHEKEYYKELFSLEDGRIESIHLGIDDWSDKYSEFVTDEGYYLAAGRSNRDYEFLVKEWPEDKRLVIVCDNKKLPAKKNIEQKFNCYRDDYFKALAKCHAVVIPLADPNASSGQLVMLQAMMLGKPIIVTENKTVRDYMIDGEDGYIINTSGNELIDAIEKIEDPMIWKTISSKGRKHYLEFHSMEAMGLSVGKSIIKEM